MGARSTGRPISLKELRSSTPPPNPLRSFPSPGSRHYLLQKSVWLALGLRVQHWGAPSRPGFALRTARLSSETESPGRLSRRFGRGLRGLRIGRVSSSADSELPRCPCCCAPECSRLESIAFDADKLKPFCRTDTTVVPHDSAT